MHLVRQLVVACMHIINSAYRAKHIPGDVTKLVELRIAALP